MKKKTKQNISKVFTILGVIGLCYVIFVDHRPKEYDKVVGAFSKYEYKARSGRHGTRTAKIQITQHPSWFHLEANGKSYDRIAKFFETVPFQTPVTLLIDKGVLSDKEHSHVVYKITVNDSIIFDRTQEEAVVNKTISLIAD